LEVKEGWETYLQETSGMIHEVLRRHEKRAHRENRREHTYGHRLREVGDR
jgi:hypothetical protein